MFKVHTMLLLRDSRKTLLPTSKSGQAKRAAASADAAGANGKGRGAGSCCGGGGPGRNPLTHHGEPPSPPPVARHEPTHSPGPTGVGQVAHPLARSPARPLTAPSVDGPGPAAAGGLVPAGEPHLRGEQHARDGRDRRGDAVPHRRHGPRSPTPDLIQPASPGIMAAECGVCGGGVVGAAPRASDAAPNATAERVADGRSIARNWARVQGGALRWQRCQCLDEAMQPERRLVDSATVRSRQASAWAARARRLTAARRHPGRGRPPPSRVGLCQLRSRRPGRAVIRSTPGRGAGLGSSRPRRLNAAPQPRCQRPRAPSPAEPRI